jgi:hypothetical protein
MNITRLYLAISLIVSLSPINAALAQADSWALDAAKAPFSQKPASGKLFGKEFHADNSMLTIMHGFPSIGGRTTPDATVALNDEHTYSQMLVGITKMSPPYENAQFSQAASASAADSPTLEVRLSGATPTTKDCKVGEFGVHLSLGKKDAKELIPVYIVLRIDKDNWVEGYCYAKIFDSKPTRIEYLKGAGSK